MTTKKVATDKEAYSSRGMKAGKQTISGPDSTELGVPSDCSHGNDGSKSSASPMPMTHKGPTRN